MTTKGIANKALILHVGWRVAGQNFEIQDHEMALREAVGLADAIGLEVSQAKVIRLAKASPSHLFGAGRIADLKAEIIRMGVSLVIINGHVTPVQQQNLEREWQVKLLDRTALILEIFGRRARTSEGRLQVELAHLAYQKSRLVRSWTHLERQRGGAGFMGGPGETQLEADRRAIGEKIMRLQKRLARVKRTRTVHRTARARVPYPVIALAGYTNAGKSTLFNLLTEAGIAARNRLFDTLDPTMRQLVLPHGQKIIISDTVGFITDLPTMLVAAFRATLEEVLKADIILHIRDMAHHATQAQAQAVRNVLNDLGIRENDERIIEIWNKMDAVPPEDKVRLQRQAYLRESPVSLPMSARTGAGVSELLATIETRLAAGKACYAIALPAADGQALSWLYRHAEILKRETAADGTITINARMATASAAKANKKFEGRLAMNLL